MILQATQCFFDMTDCWWKKSCNTWEEHFLVNNGINYLSTGAGFLNHQQDEIDTLYFWVVFFGWQRRGVLMTLNNSQIDEQLYKKNILFYMHIILSIYCRYIHIYLDIYTLYISAYEIPFKCDKNCLFRVLTQVFFGFQPLAALPASFPSQVCFSLKGRNLVDQKLEENPRNALLPG